MVSNERETEALTSEISIMKDQVSVLEERISMEDKMMRKLESDVAMEICVEKQIGITNLEIELMDVKARCTQKEIRMGQIQRDTSLRMQNIKKKKNDLLVSSFTHMCTTKLILSS